MVIPQLERKRDRLQCDIALRLYRFYSRQLSNVNGDPPRLVAGPQRRYGAHLIRIGKSLFLGRTERDLERVHDPVRDVVLNFEDISQIVVVAVRPNVPAGSSVGKLRADPHALASTADGTFEHRALRPAGDLPG